MSRLRPAALGELDEGVRLDGREPEHAAIDRLLEEARRSRSAALVVRAEVGVGKSALLGYARRRGAELTSSDERRARRLAAARAAWDAGRADNTTAMKQGLAPHNSIAEWAVGLLHLALGH